MAQEVVLEKQDRIVGRHVFGNLYDVDPEILRDRDFLLNVVLEAVKIANMKLVEAKSWEFGGRRGSLRNIPGRGESHSTSHVGLSIVYATLDVYTCGDHSDPKAAFDYIVSKLKPGRYQTFYADRSS